MLLPETENDLGAFGADDPPPGKIEIRKPWDWPENVASRPHDWWWPDALAPLFPRRRTIPTERCHHCGEHPAATAPWRPNHPIFSLLCTNCRGLVYNLAFRVALRRGGDLRPVLDGLLAVMALLD